MEKLESRNVIFWQKLAGELANTITWVILITDKNIWEDKKELNIKEKYYIHLELLKLILALFQATGKFIIILTCQRREERDPQLVFIKIDGEKQILARKATRKPFKMLNIFLKWMKMIWKLNTFLRNKDTNLGSLLMKPSLKPKKVLW